MTKQEQLNVMMSDTILGDIDTPELSEFDNADKLAEYIEERINEHEVIYYSTAMNYLMEHDTSLRESLELASDMGFEVKNLNSETLATLHKQEAMRKELYDIMSDIEELFESEDA